MMGCFFTYTETLSVAHEVLLHASLQVNLYLSRNMSTKDYIFLCTCRSHRLHKEEVTRVAALAAAESSCSVSAVSVSMPETILTPRGRNLLRYEIDQLPKMVILPLQVQNVPDKISMVF